MKAISAAKSLCPVCLKKIEVEYVIENNNVYMKKNAQNTATSKPSSGETPSSITSGSGIVRTPKKLLCSGYKQQYAGNTFVCLPCDQYKRRTVVSQ